MDWPIQLTPLGRCLSKVVSSSIHPANSPSRDWHSPKWLLPCGEGNITTHTSVPMVTPARPYSWQYRKSILLIRATEVPADGLGSDIVSDCWPHSPIETSQRMAQVESPAILCHCSLGRWVEGKHLFWWLTLPNYKPTVGPNWPPRSTRTKPCPMCPQQAKWVIAANVLNWRQMWLSHNSREHRTHIGDTSEVPGSVEQGALTPQDLFLIKMLLSRSGDIAGFTNT